MVNAANRFRVGRVKVHLPPRRRGRQRSSLATDPWQRVRVGLGILGFIIALGVVGYRLLGLGLFDALYQTVITVTTVGYGEIGDPEDIDRSYRWFSLFLALFGVGGALYTLGVMVDAYVEGSLNDGLRIRKEQRMIDRLSGHLIIAGAGRVGASIAHYVVRHGAEVVVIEQAPSDSGHLTVLGDATDDETLRRAGIERATTLIAALDTDASNLYVTLSARALNPDLHIVARTNHQSNEPKLFQAGADRVVNPHEIGGSRMGALALHPNLAEFLDEVLHDESHGVTVGEIKVGTGSRADGHTLRKLLGATGQPLVIAIRDQDHGYTANPALDTVVNPGAVLVVLGSDTDVAALRVRVT